MAGERPTIVASTSAGEKRSAAAAAASPLPLDPGQQRKNVLVAERLGEEVERPELDRLDRHGNAAVGGHHDDFHVGLRALLDPLQQFDAVDFRHLQIGHHDVEPPGGELLERFLAVGRGDDFMPLRGQIVGQRDPLDLFVVDDEDFHGSFSTVRSFIQHLAELHGVLEKEIAGFDAPCKPAGIANDQVQRKGVVDLAAEVQRSVVSCRPIRNYQQVNVAVRFGTPAGVRTKENDPLRRDFLGDALARPRICRNVAVFSVDLLTSVSFFPDVARTPELPPTSMSPLDDGVPLRGNSDKRVGDPEPDLPRSLSRRSIAA